MTTSRKLSDVLQFIRGVTFSPEELVVGGEPGAMACMRTKNIQKELDDSDLIYVPASVVKREEQVLQESDLLISSANSWELVGKTVRVGKLSYPATAGGFIAILRPNREWVDPEYLFRFISWGRTQHEIRHLGRQTTNISNLDRERFLELPIPLPPLAIQRQIGKILEQADCLRRQAQQMEAELDRLAQALFLEMFGDPVTNPKGWPIKSIQDVAKVTTGNTPSRARSEYFGGYVEWIKSDNINTPSWRLTTAEEYLSEAGAEVGRIVESGAVLLTCIAGSPDCIGNAAITDRKVAFNQQINAVIPKDEFMVAEYFYMLCLVGKKIIQSASTNSMKGMVSKGSLEKLKIPVPPIELQELYRQRFLEVGKSAALSDSKIVAMTVLFNSLMQRAFKGELTPKLA